MAILINKNHINKELIRNIKNDEIITLKASVKMELTIEGKKVKPVKELAVYASREKNVSSKTMDKLIRESMIQACKGKCPAYNRQILSARSVK